MSVKRNATARGSARKTPLPARARRRVPTTRGGGVLLNESALRNSEERFRLLVDRVRDHAISMLDPEGTIVSWNEGAKRIKGYRADEIIGQNMSRFYAPDDIAAGHPQRLLSLAAREGRTEEEGWRVRKGGQLFWADVVITALRDESGRLRGFAKVTRDLTERKKAEEALRESQQRLRAIFDNSPSILFLKDTNGVYLDCNPPFEAMVGRKRDQIIGKTDEQILPPQQAAEYTGHDQEVLREGRTMHFEETAVHSDGEHFSLVAKFPLRDPIGTIYAVGGIVTDITD